MSVDDKLAEGDDGKGNLDLPPDPLAAFDLAAMGIVDSDEIQQSAYARVLLLGAAKMGKSVSILHDAPAPYVINGDGGDSQLPAKRFRSDNPDAEGRMIITDVNNRADWVRAQKNARQLSEAGAIRTIVVDTISMLALSIVNDLKLKGFEGFDLWNELNEQLQGGYRRLASLPAHLVLIAHMDPSDEDGITGIMPLIPGKSKTVLPALINDWILLHYDPDSKRRSYLLGPQGKWTHSGRNVNRSVAVDASFTALCAELGIKP